MDTLNFDYNQDPRTVLFLQSNDFQYCYYCLLFELQI